LTFDKIRLDHKQKIDTFLNNFEPYSDFNFVSLYSWAIGSGVDISMSDDSIFIKLPDYITQNPVFSFLIKGNFNTELVKILKWMRDNGHPLEFKLVPEANIYHIRNYLESIEINHSIREDKGEFDYIINVEDLFKSIGSQYQDHRYKISKLKRTWGDRLKKIEFNPRDDKHVNDAFELSKSWFNSKRTNQSMDDTELLAIDRFFKLSSRLPSIRFSALCIDNKLVAFSSYEVLSNEYAIGHFLKYVPEIRGLYDFLLHESAADLYSLGIEKINIEQDLDVQNLRSAKMHLRPCKYLKKFSVEIQD
jgi:hypothetical protein